MDHSQKTILPRQQWLWDETSVHGTMKLNDQKNIVTFPRTSSSTVAVVGDTALKPGYIYYWEIKFIRDLYGTDIMVGVGTKNARRAHREYCSLLGLDNESWGYSYRGYRHHGGIVMAYSYTYTANDVIGVLLDTFAGTLEFFKNGHTLGIAFQNVSRTEDLYPMVSCTAARCRVELKYCANVPHTLKAQILVLFCQTDEGLHFIRSVPGLRQLLKENWWLVKRDVGDLGPKTIHNISSEEFCWEHFDTFCPKCFPMKGRDRIAPNLRQSDLGNLCTTNSVFGILNRGLNQFSDFLAT